MLGPLDQPRPLPPGFVEEEWFLIGRATGHRLVGERSPDGTWEVEPAGEADYTTRLVVRRPAEADRFSGTVVVEWINVTAGADMAPEWSMVHRHLGRAGHAWVGVSAQAAGIQGGGLVAGDHLTAVAPDRYGALHHPGDAYAYDVFTQAGRLLRAGAGPLRDLPVERLIAAGVSQSALALTTYYDAIAPGGAPFDGYLVHSRSAGAFPLDGWDTAGAFDDVVAGFRTDVVRFRTDVAAPVLVLQAETDVLAMGAHAARQPDSATLRYWEVAGSAHADTYQLLASPRHDEATTAADLVRLTAPATAVLPWMAPTSAPVNSGLQMHYVAQAAVAALDEWVRTGRAPAAAPPLEVDPAGAAFVTDEAGIARGGIRTPWVDVPMAVLSGLGAGTDPMAFLFGTTRPFEPAELSERYPGGRDEFVARFASAADDAAAAGFLLREDLPEIHAVGAAAYPGPG
ncbi:alpha/beta hydrolase domain-containing protein [Pseudonocardia sp. RS010]|uniref:alpha/beta hydrolase domain-containing protein n=1 Tax=Pseudonocardia sp. RS010 TaxID=3385979 RepID=UPI0039A3B60D